MTRRGFSLVELLISLVLLGLVGAMGIRVLLALHWSAVTAGERGALQASLRGGALYLAGELRELGGTPGDPDIIAFAPESLTYRAMRGAGIACHLASGVVSLEASTWSGYRAPQPGRDSLLIHQENDPWTPGDDRWLHLPISGLAGGSCGPTMAQDVTTPLNPVQYPASTFGPLVPVRTFEIMQIRLYQSGGEYWLGTRSVSGGEIIQPVIGPLSSRGLSLTFFDSTGTSTSVMVNIRSIGITLRGLTSSAIRSGGGFGPSVRATDSLVTRVLLRNW